MQIKTIVDNFMFFIIKHLTDPFMDFVKTYIYPFVRKHPCLSVFLFLIWYNRDIALAYYVANPIRCQMWQDQNIKVFLTPEEWRSLSGVKESLKRTRWLSLSIEEEKKFFKSKGMDYKDKMYFDGKEYYLSYFNREYPNLNIYRNYTLDDGFNKATNILYDHRLERKIVKYRLLSGAYGIGEISYSLGFMGRANFSCENGKSFEELIYSYLN